MSEPTIGVGRIVIPYAVSGLEHEARMYVANPTLTGSVYNIDQRPSIGGTVLWSTAAQHFAETLSYVLATGVTPGTAVLEEYFATGWIPVATAAVTFPNLSGGSFLASQMVTTLRASDFTRPKIIVMEQTSTAPSKFTSPTGGGAVQDSFISQFLSTGTLGARPWVVMTNMHGIHLATNPFISFTTTYNKKLRRARGLA